MKSGAVSISHRSGRLERGTQLFEVALVLPILLLLVVTGAEFGRYFYTYSVLDRATRIAARYVAGHNFTDTEKNRAKNLAVCGSLTTDCASGTGIVPGLTTTNIQITSTGSSLLPETVTVQIINYTYQPIFNLGNWIGGTWANVAVSPSTTMRYLLEN